VKFELLVFKINGDDADSSALSFEQSDSTIDALYYQMADEEVEAIEDVDEGWTVTLHARISLKSVAHGNEIKQLLADLANDDWLGDYDRRKGTDYATLILRDGEVVEE
jgi:hypothetical protein